MSSSPSATTTNNSTDVSPQQIGKAFVVQYYRLLHEHPESLHRFYSSSSTFMHDDPNKIVTGIENISKRIEELSLKQRHVKIRQVDCHSTVGSSVVVQVCGEISTTSITDNQTPIMKRFVQTFVLAPTDNAKQKYYVHNDIFRYQDNPTSITTTDNNNNNTKISSITTDNEGKYKH
jgi:Nuclear transport factor 2 (NTF2) domain